jgi:DNA-binding MarR family transcriptional regulator
MDEALRPLGLTVAQYSCLQLIGERPGVSSAELARGMFVSRQSMNLVLRCLRGRGLVERPDTAPQARSLPARLTPAGRRLAKRADQIVAAIEARMIAALPPSQQSQLLTGLTACAEALNPQNRRRGMLDYALEPCRRLRMRSRSSPADPKYWMCSIRWPSSGTRWYANDQAPSDSALSSRGSWCLAAAVFTPSRSFVSRPKL